MDKPTLTINGTVHTIKELKARDWRIFAEFVGADLKPTDSDFVDKHAAFIAYCFDVNVEDVLNQVYLCDIMPIFADIHRYFMTTIFDRLEASMKEINADLEHFMGDSGDSGEPAK